MLPEAVQLRLAGERRSQIPGLADLDFFMAGTAIVAVFMHALGHEIDRRHGSEPRFQRPYLEVALLS